MLKDPEELASLVEFLVPYDEALQELTLAARSRLREILPPANEIFYDANSAVCSGFTFTDKVSGNFLNLAVFPKHLNLIFAMGAFLQDPHHLLKGEGNQVRHMRIPSLDILSDPRVLDLIDQATANAKQPPAPLPPQTIVKVMAGRKRRP